MRECLLIVTHVTRLITNDIFNLNKKIPVSFRTGIKYVANEVHSVLI
jgi:hypothetical protein